MRALLTTTVAIATTTIVIAQQQVIVNNPDINDDNNLQQRRSSLLSRSHNQASTQKATHKGYEKEQLSRRLNKERNTSAAAASAAAAAGGGVGSNNENNKTGVKRTSRHTGTNGEGVSRGSGGRRRGGRDKESVVAGESNADEEVKGTPKGGESKESTVETTLAAAEEVIEDEKIILESLSEQVGQSSTQQQEEEESTNNNEKLQQHSINKLPNIAGGLYNVGLSVTDRIKKVYTGIDNSSGSKGGNEIPYDNNTPSNSKWDSPMPSATYSPSPSTTDTSTTMEPTWEGDDWKTPKPTTWNDDDWTGSSWMTKGSTMKSKHSSDSKSKKTTPTKKSSSTWNSWDDNTPPPTPLGDSSWDHPSWDNDDDIYPSWGDDDMWSTKSNKSHKTHKTNKSSTKERTMSVCTKRLITAFEQIEEFNGKGQPFEGIYKPSDVTKHCSFMPPMNEEHINYGCPFIYDPNNPMADEPTGYGFVEGEKEYQMYWKKKHPSTPSETVEKFAKAYNNFAQYCQCYQGYDMGCATRIPHGPPTQETKYMNDRLAIVNGYSEYLKPDGTTSERAEFCKLVGVWNGDFLTDVVQDFTDDVKDCGCYWIGVAKDMVGTCPGVELGAWYKFPPLPGPTPSPSPAPTPPPTPDETIAEIVDGDDDLATLNAALKAAGLVDTLNGDGPFTLFAPTDEAFAKLPDGAVADLLKPENKQALIDLLTYHVVAARALSSDLSNGQDIGTVNGKDVHVTISDDGSVMINQAKVIDADILARNGVIHKIDEVLLPPEITLVDSFEPGVTEFPDGPWEVDYYYDEVFETTDTQAFEGDWSVETPDICNASSTNDDFSFMTLTIPDLGPGKLTYYVNSKDLNYPADVLVLVANDDDDFTQGWTGNSTNDGPDEWNKYTLDLQNGRSTGPQGIMSASTEVNSLTWYYICKPNEYDGAKSGGRAYVDYITFTPSNKDMEMIDLSPPKYWTFPDP